MTFAMLSTYFSKLEETASRNAMTEILADLFSETRADEIDLVCYLSLGRLVPLYESLEFQLAEKMVIHVIAQAFDVREEAVQKEYKKIGDLGTVARQLKSKLKIQRSKLSVLDVYRRLREIAEEAGKGSRKRKVDGLALLLHDLDPTSCKYVVRMVLGRLRLGFSDVTILDALSWMRIGSKELRVEIERAYFVRADIGTIAKRFKQKGLKGIESISAELGVPVMPALCQRLKSADEMIKKMGMVAVEPKYDGQRVQIHYKGGRKSWVRAFTRNLEEVSFMFPELSKIGQQIRVREAILDSEAVGYDAKTGKILPFQQIITRKRKHAILEAAKAVPLRFFVFDLLYKDGKSLLGVPLSKRVDLLKKVVRGAKVLVKTERVVTDDAHQLRAYHHEQLEAGLEGAVVKKWDYLLTLR
ncbi:ATP-dependent DNA ligase [Patescibacteria group bacterium]|nr:ATP-dependent DNA ligase [Patescibacteria group bacterium]